MKKIILTLILITSLITGSSTCFAAGTNTSPIKSSTYLVSEKQGSSYLQTNFVRYLTQSWAKAERYSWSTAQTAALSFSAGLSFEAIKSVKADLGLTSSRTYTYGVSTFIPAVKGKYSKLAFYVTYNVGKVKVTKYNTLWFVGNKVYTEKVSSSTGKYYEPTKTSYLKVKYQ